MNFLDQIHKKQQAQRAIKIKINAICKKIAKTIEKNINSTLTSKHLTYNVRHTKGFCFIISLEMPNKTYSVSDIKNTNISFKKLNFYLLAPNEDINSIVQICKETLENSQQ